MVRRFAVAGVVAAALIVAACSNSGGGAASNPSIAAPPNCSVDGALACSGSTGFSCASGSNPEDADGTLVCSTPVTAGAQDEYCCFAGAAGSQSTCQSDDTLQCPSGTFGYSCASGDDPADFDATLSCSAGSGGDDDGGAAVFCCATGTFPGDDGGDEDGGSNVGCTADDTVTCTGNASGYACTAGANPQVIDPTLACSPTDTSAQGRGVYCCFSGFLDASAATCAPDDDVGLGCSDGTYGFACAAGDTSPEKQDPALSMCSVSTTAGDQDDYCCVYD